MSEGREKTSGLVNGLNKGVTYFFFLPAAFFFAGAFFLVLPAFFIAIETSLWTRLKTQLLVFPFPQTSSTSISHPPPVSGAL